MSDHHICTADNPYRKGVHNRVAHPDARILYTEDDFSVGLQYDHFHCPNCDMRFVMEVAQ